MNPLVFRAFVKYASGQVNECSIKKDKDGWYATTHRARSKSYPSKSAIPTSVKKWVGSTG